MAPQPLANLPCGTTNPITCAVENTAIVASSTTIPPKKAFNTPFLTANRYHKYQFIIKKSDMLYYGIYSGTLNSMSFKTLNATVASTVPLEFVTVSLGCIPVDTFPKPITNSSFYQGTVLNQVASLGSYTITGNAWNNIKFDAPYSWDTSKNLLVELCVGPINVPDVKGTDPVAMVEGTAIQKSNDFINVCGGNVPVVNQYYQRPAVQFNYCETPQLPFAYTWLPGDNLKDSTAQNPLAFVPRSIKYTVNSVGRNGCKIRDELNIFVPNHVLNVGPQDTFICQGQPAFLYASGGDAYGWFEVNEGVFTSASGSLNCTDCATPVAKPKTATTYAVVFQNNQNMSNPINANAATGCPDTLFTTVNVWTLPDVGIVNHDTTITIGQSVELYVRGAQHFSWSPSGLAF